MGEDLKKTGAGNLFTVFGEPDIELRDTQDGQVVVDLKGVDVYDPTTGEVRSNDTSQIALSVVRRIPANNATVGLRILGL